MDAWTILSLVVQETVSLKLFSAIVHLGSAGAWMKPASRFPVPKHWVHLNVMSLKVGTNS